MNEGVSFSKFTIFHWVVYIISQIYEKRFKVVYIYIWFLSSITPTIF